MRLYTPTELEQLQQDSDEILYLNEITGWVKNFLGKPHPELGRSGAVCPFIPRALKLNTIQLAVIRTKNLEPQQIEEIVKHYREVFLNLEPGKEELAFHKSIMLIFPDIPEAAACQLIDGVQQRLKPFFVEAGLMLGEFHQRNESPGLHNVNFRPLRSPIPMLAIRFMTESDLPFLDRLTDNPAVRIQYLEAYLKQMSTIIKDEKKLSKAQAALTLAQTQLEQNSLETPEQKTERKLEQDHIEVIYPSRRCPFARLAEFLSLKLAQLQSLRWLIS